MSDPTGPTERAEFIEAKLDRMSDDQTEAMDVLGAGLTAVGGTVTNLMANLELALLAQREAEANRVEESAQNKRRFWVTISGIVLANVVVVAIAVIVLVGQQDARELADKRSQINRDRQSCFTSLLVEFDEKLGEALRVSTTIPPVPQDSPEFRQAIGELNDTTMLLGRVQELCYGNTPNPEPVPNR